MPNRVRGVRQTLPPNTVVGRLNGTGAPQQINLIQAIQQAIQSGAFAIPGSPTALATIANLRLLANISGGTASPIANTLTAVLDAIMGSTEGQILQRGASAWQVLAPGTNGQVLTSGGAAALNSWTTPAGGGTTISNAGAWNGNSGYTVGQVVTYEGAAYLCYVGVSAPAAPATQWQNQNLMTISTTNTTNDTAVSQAGANGVAQGNVGQTSGKWYYEFTCSNLLDNGDQVGIEQAALANNGGGNPLGNISFSAGWGGGSGSFGGLTNGSRGAVAFDEGNKKFWITKDVTASPINWNGQTVNNPGSGLSAIVLTGTMGTVYPLFYSASSAGQKIILYTRDADFLIPAIPSGFSGWRAAATPNNPPDEDSAHWVAQGNTYAPGGRLSLTSNVAVQTADVVGGTTIYYVPYIHRGLGHLGLDLAAQISLALDSNSGHTGYHQSGKNFDIAIDGSTGTPRLVTSPAWAGDTTSVATRGWDQTTVPGLWTNTSSMTVKFDTTSSTYSAPAGTLLWVGSFRASANGQTTCQFSPAGALGGSNTQVLLYNVYNRVRKIATSNDTTVTWTYAVATYRAANNSTSNRISFLDGLGASDIWGIYSNTVQPASVIGANGIVGSDLDSTTATPNVAFTVINNAAQVFLESLAPVYNFIPTLGFHYIQAIEQSGSGTTTFYGGINQLLSVYLEL